MTTLDLTWWWPAGKLVIRRRWRAPVVHKWKWIVALSEEQRRDLQSLLRKGKSSARRITRARILLLAAENRPDDEVAAALHTSRSTVERVRRRFVEQGLAVALSERPRPGAVPKLDERGQATLIALACSDPPKGRGSWTMKLLADELVVRRVVPSISDEAVRRTLKKTDSSRGFRSTGASRK
jgi:transposase